MVGTFFLLAPFFSSSLVWFVRIFVWVFLGPLVKIFDIVVVHSRYRTREELEANPELVGNPISESVLKSEKVQALIKKGHLACEEATKLKDMREYRFGKLSQLIPATDTQRTPDIPLANLSTAQPYLGSTSNADNSDGFVDIPQEQITWVFAPGQKLVGNMVHCHETLADKKSKNKLKSM